MLSPHSSALANAALVDTTFELAVFEGLAQTLRGGIENVDFGQSEGNSGGCSRDVARFQGHRGTSGGIGIPTRVAATGPWRRGKPPIPPCPTHVRGGRRAVRRAKLRTFIARAILGEQRGIRITPFSSTTRIGGGQLPGCSFAKSRRRDSDRARGGRARCSSGVPAPGAAAPCSRRVSPRRA